MHSMTDIYDMHILYQMFDVDHNALQPELHRTVHNRSEAFSILSCNPVPVLRSYSSWPNVQLQSMIHQHHNTVVTASFELLFQNSSATLYTVQFAIPVSVQSFTVSDTVTSAQQWITVDYMSGDHTLC